MEIHKKSTKNQQKFMEIIKKTMENHKKNNGKSQKHGKSQKPWKNHKKNNGKTTTTMEKSQNNHGKIMENLKK